VTKAIVSIFSYRFWHNVCNFTLH